MSEQFYHRKSASRSTSSRTWSWAARSVSHIFKRANFSLVIKQVACRVIDLPHYNGLTTENLLNIRGDYPQLSEYFPEERDLPKIPRAWLANVIYTIVGDQFNQWVQERIRERNDRVASQHDLMIELDPAIARAFEASTMISSKYSKLIPSLTCSVL